MLRYVVRRVLFSIPVLLVASFLLFTAVRVTFDPTDRLRHSPDPQAVQRARHELGLDKPIAVQYRSWLSGFVRGDWGESSRTREPVYPVIRRACWNTLQLVVWAVLFAMLVAVGVGVLSAARQYSLSDYALTSLSFLGLSMPPFWFGLIAIQFMAVYPQDWFNLRSTPFFFVGLRSSTTSGVTDYVRHLVLPVLTLTVQLVASWSRYQRASMLDALSADYVRTARAKGVPDRQVIFKHAFRNAVIPLVTVMALDMGTLAGGLIVTEQIFSIPGMGRLFVDSLLSGDANVLVAWTVVTAMFVIGFNLLADLVYGSVDPRIQRP
ncbi:MAG: ABC transporter permease [Actinomycetota bacterium]|nr:ABC transporter permease [Actinomycetota bacterium]